MKKIIFLLLICITISCQNEKQLERLNSWLDYKPELMQQFFVSPDSIVTIEGKKGTKITFKTEDLEGLLNGPNIQDSLQIYLIELTNKQELLLANTQTISNGKWLISGGAFEIDIRANGESLTLKEGKTIIVDFPKTCEVNDMRLFYGEKEENDNMNWNETNIVLKEKKYFSIYYKFGSQLDSTLTSKYGGVETYDSVLYADTLGYLTINDYKSRYTKIDSIYVLNDTLSNSKTWRNYDDFLDDITNKAYTISDAVYQRVEISKLGWTNIDKFAPEEEKITITLKSNKVVDATQTYIVDTKNNTILNVIDNEVDIPINRSFYIISFGLKEDTFYAYKKSIRFKKSGEHIIKYKKIKESQLKSILKLD
jgi:hypothetical protein